MQTLRQFQELFNEYLTDNQFDKSPKELYEPVRYIMNLGGKRMRPLMVLIAHSMFDADFQKSLPAAFSIEIFHNFSLVHDDIMDKALLRRGKPTVHAKYSTNNGILSGDVMLIYAYDYLSKIEKTELLGELLVLFNKTAIEVCEGQQLDMDFEERKDVSLSEYLQMIEWKTAVLLACALKMGARIGGASIEDANHLYEFGRNVGLAFQMQDDVLDTFGDPEKFGKRVGGDILQNKKTYLVLKTLELATEKDKDILSQIMSTSTNGLEEEEAKIEEVRQLFNRYDIRAQAEQAKEAYQKIAFEHLKAVFIAPNKKELLQGVATSLLGREV